jgi:CheY-like chemotaxis protein
MNKIILLVDDDEDDIHLFHEALQEVNDSFQLVTANNGMEALDLVLNNKVKPDHIFLDINMPVMNGLECLEELKKRNKIPPLLVTIYTTSAKGFSGFERCLELGASYLIKPCSYNDIVQSLRQKLIQT